MRLADPDADVALVPHPHVEGLADRHLVDHRQRHVGVPHGVLQHDVVGYAVARGRSWVTQTTTPKNTAPRANCRPVTVWTSRTT